VWLADKFDVYVVQVQGSARLRLTDGREMQIGYAGKTEYPYTSIGKAMVKDGKFEKKDLSLRKIREYFRAHPEDVDTYLQTNNCYVFFQESEGGPYGSLGCKVTPFRSLATDKAVFPRGGVAFAVTKLPTMSAGRRVGDREFRSFVMDQDTGGGIRSAGRGDIFFGTGPDAEAMAGAVSDEGRLYYVFVKPPFNAPGVAAK
jgi:membrane-bound lytic murein transglycosylase A